MARLLVVLVFVAVMLTVFALVDCILFSRLRVRGIPKPAWIFVILLFPIIGSVLWFLVGRGRKDSGRSAGFRTVGPDDDPDFLGTLPSQVVIEDRIRDLEQQLAESDDDSDRGKTDNGSAER